MSDNPYAPPSAPVADVYGTAPPTNISPHVLRACTLWWCSFALSLLPQIRQVLKFDAMSLRVGGFIGLLIGGVIGYFITLWIVSKLRGGRNWMRLLLTILAVAGAIIWLIFWKFMVAAYTSDLIQAALSLIQFGLSIWAVVLLNTEQARTWFAAMKQAGYRPT